jgi:hypothetical protein
VSGEAIPSRSCLVCQQPCRTEGQLCPDCAAAGHRVTDTEVIVNIEIEWPPSRVPSTSEGEGA